MAKTKLGPVTGRENWTHHRSIRIEDTDWSSLETVAEHYGGRATVVRRLLKLFLRDDWLGKRIRAAVGAMPDAIHTGGDFRSPEAQAKR